MQMRYYVTWLHSLYFHGWSLFRAHAVLTIELIAFNQSTFELIMETENVTSLVIKE